MLKLPVPEAEYENVVLKPSEYQKEMVQSLADRAEAVRDRRVDLKDYLMFLRSFEAMQANGSIPYRQRKQRRRIRN